MTRFAFLSDIHGNLPALDTVLAKIKFELKIPANNILCLGDIVGYYPWITECVSTIRDLEIRTVAGNHDIASSDSNPKNVFLTLSNPIAQEALKFTRLVLERSPDDLEYLKSLPSITRGNSYEAVHNSPAFVGGFEYVTTPDDAIKAIKAMQKEVAFIGHTHQPCVYKEHKKDDGETDVRYYDLNDLARETGRKPFKLDPGVKYLVNIGSVGQSRDSNPQACFVVFDDEKKTIQYYRVDYDVREVQEAVRSSEYGKTTFEKLAKVYKKEMPKEHNGVPVSTVGDFLAVRLEQGN